MARLCSEPTLPAVTDGAIDREGECTELLQALIRNACVNDGTDGVGRRIPQRRRCWPAYLEGPGLDLETYEAAPGRTSLVARIEGTDPTAPTLLLMGHTDVVPVNPEHWSRDPFGGELVDGEVWGRGAVDMLNLTSSMAVAVRRLARSGFRPRGTLVYLAVADEEELGEWGADHLLRHERDAVAADYVITESGGIPLPSARRAEAPGDRRGEGRAVGEAPHRRHRRATARSRTGPTTRWSPRPRSSAGWPSTGASRASTTSGGGSSPRWATPTRSPSRCSPPTASTT